MKREHSAYFEYFVTQDKSGKWNWLTRVYRIPRDLGKVEELRGTAKDEAAAHKEGQAAGKVGIEKYRIKEVE